MGIKYREDGDLEFLKKCDNKDLGILVDFLTKDKDKVLRITEQLTSEERFKKCKKRFSKRWDLIAGELQLFGADTIVSSLRGTGVLYREILTDVCDKVKVNYNSKSPIEKIENNLLLKIVEDSLEKMSEEEKREFVKGFKLNTVNFSTVAIMAALQTAINLGGFASYQMSVVVANTVARQLIGRGLAITANAGLTKSLAIFAGPIGWVIAGLLALPMISGPAYRVTIPSVIQVAYMRQKMFANEGGYSIFS